jgi:hypothetical protein
MDPKDEELIMDDNFFKELGKVMPQLNLNPNLHFNLNPKP